MSMTFRMFECTFMRDRCVSRFCVIVDLSQVLSLLRFEKDCSDEATEMGTHKQS